MQRARQSSLLSHSTSYGGKSYPVQNREQGWAYMFIKGTIYTLRFVGRGIRGHEGYVEEPNGRKEDRYLEERHAFYRW